MSALSRIFRRWCEARFVHGAEPASLNEWQEAFCVWTAERHGISAAESRSRFTCSWAALRGGPGGKNFRLFSHACQEVLLPFASDELDEVFLAAQLHGPIDLLRMLSYRCERSNPIPISRPPGVRSTHSSASLCCSLISCQNLQTTIRGSSVRGTTPWRAISPPFATNGA